MEKNGHRRARKEGKRRATNWTALASGTEYLWQNQLITRGYTFHEQLDPIGLIHMNGRVYDPEIGRFLSADIAIQDISNSQSLNAYSYVMNNPLSFTDPSGFFLRGLFHKIGNFFRSIGHAIGRVVRSSIGRAILQIIACANPAAAFTCPAAAVGLTLAAGGSIGQALIAGAFAWAQLPGSEGGLDIWGAVGTAVARSGTELAGTIVTHAVVSGALSVAQGGSFVSGAISGAVGSVGSALGAKFGVDPITRVAISAATGGTASVLSGGKFANGAVTSAFATMYNDLRDHGAAMAAAEVGASMVPGVGEAMDLSVVFGSGYSVGERLLAGGSLFANILTGGLLPNAGGLIRGAEHLSDDVIRVTKEGVAIPSDAKYAIPSRYAENPYRTGSYGEVVDGKFVERLRIDPATPPGMKGPNYSHYHNDNGRGHYSPRPGDRDPGFPR